MQQDTNFCLSINYFAHVRQIAFVMEVNIEKVLPEIFLNQIDKVSSYLSHELTFLTMSVALNPCIPAMIRADAPGFSHPAKMRTCTE